MEEVEKKIYPKIYPLFCAKVYTVSQFEPIGNALKLMYENSFSQIPVYEIDIFMGLLTNNTVSRWLGSCVKEEIFSLYETRIVDVFDYAENSNNYFFIEKCSDVKEALQKFTELELAGEGIDAVLITENGRPTEPLLGIITRSDIPKLLNKLDEAR